MTRRSHHDAGGEGPGPSPLLVTYGAVMRSLPVVSGTTKLSYNPVVKRLIGNERRRATAMIEGHIPIDVDLAEYHGRVLYLFGTNDPKVRGVCLALSRPGDVFMDIGANYSSIGFAVAPAIGDAGHVHLFEPQPAFERPLTDAIGASGYANVTLHPVGLLDEAGSIEMAVPERHSGMATMATERMQDGWRRIDVEVREVSSVVAEVAGDRPLGGKIDVEGVEPRILPAVLSAEGFAYVVFEGCSNRSALFAMTTAHGVAMYGIERSPMRIGLTRITEEGAMASHHDFVFVRYRDGLPLRARGADAMSSLRAAA